MQTRRDFLRNSATLAGAGSALALLPADPSRCAILGEPQSTLGAFVPNNPAPVVNYLEWHRAYKTPYEIALMRQAQVLGVRGHRAAEAAFRNGADEFSIHMAYCQAVGQDANELTYGNIVALNEHAAVLHYTELGRKAPQPLRSFLIDAGASAQGYASDITRTFPVNGRFSAEQRALHDLGGEAQAAALAQAKPGVPYESGHLAAVQTLTEGLLRLGLLKGTLEKNLSEGLYQRFYRHKTGHWIGLDVHDVGDYRLAGDSRLLEPGMAFTIEPGLYIGVDDTTVEPRWRGIGIRTEDDVLITDDGHRVLTEGLARSADEIEAVMAG
ncbi:hypothetical protein G6F59_013412 [Rhizopus arrhizus]|nr:hypothetical protein G6F59_013412 [Rhizopus arrhizus]